MLKFNDGNNWLQKRITGVRSAYKIPKNISGVAVDIGANIGAFSVVNHENFDKIISFEPASQTFERCKEQTSSFDNVSVYQYAVGKHSGDTVKLRHYKDAFYSGNATTLDDPKWYNDSDYEEVETISLEDIYTKFNLNKINYLKIDCEGGEYDFLMKKDISNIDYIAIEIHIQLGNKGKELLEYLKQTHDVISHHGDGVNMHFEITLKSKAME